MTNKPYRRGEVREVCRPADNPASQPLPAGAMYGKTSGGSAGGVAVSTDAGKPYRAQRKQPKPGNSY
ncbi:hypothetical protein J3169_004401 [Salmonella enterica]|nr:hypothetical protein [Salmonella enterica]